MVFKSPFRTRIPLSQCQLCIYMIYCLLDYVFPWYACNNAHFPLSNRESIIQCINQTTNRQATGCLAPPHTCACPKPWSWFPLSDGFGLFCVLLVHLKWDLIVLFVDIGRIDDKHCLNFHFISQIDCTSIISVHLFTSIYHSRILQHPEVQSIQDGEDRIVRQMERH